MNEGWISGLIIGLAGPVLVFLASFLTHRATKGKTQADVRTAQEKRMDDRMEAYTTKIEARLEHMESDNETLRGKVEVLEAHQDSAEQRERIVFSYLARLRDHITRQLPPPPPAIPDGLVEWFEDLESTFPRGSA